MSTDPNTPRNFSAFSSAAAETRAGQDARQRDQTTEERTVVALERIADQLALIRLDLTSMDDFVRGSEQGEDKGDSFLKGGEPLDSTGGNPISPLPETDPDVVRTLEERFGVGGYSYTNLQHAIAEAKRARRVRDRALPATQQ